MYVLVGLRPILVLLVLISNCIVLLSECQLHVVDTRTEQVVYVDYDIDCKAGDENIGNKLLIVRVYDDICKAIQGVNDQNAAHFIEYL